MKLHVGKNKIASLYYVSSSLITKLAVFIVTPLMTKALAPHEFGVYVIFTSYLSIVSVFSTLEMSGSSIYGALSKRENKNDFIFSLLVFQFFLSLFFLLIYLPFRAPINAYTSLSTPLSLMLIFQIFLNSAEGLHLAEARFSLEYKRVSYINIGIGVLSALLSLLLIIKADLGGEGRIYAQLITSFLFVFPIIASVIARRPTFDKSVFLYAKKTLIPLIPHYLSASLMAQSGRIIISKMLGEAAVGSYGACGALSLAVSLVSVGISNALLPWINRNYSEENVTRVVSTVKKCVLSVCAFTFVFLYFAPYIYRFLYPREYAYALSLIYPLSIGQIFVFISNIYSQLLYRIDRVFTVSVISLAGGALCIGLSVLLVLKIGILGAGIGWLVSEIFLTLMKAFILRKGGFGVFSSLAAPTVATLLFFIPFSLIN